MDNGHQRSNGRHRVDIYKGAHAQPQSQPHPHAHPHPHSQSHPSQWNMLAQHSIYPFANERDMAIKDRDRALAEKKAALEERDLAIQQRDTAILERDNAFRERDNAIAALRFQESTMNSSFQRTGTTKRAHNQRSLALQVYKNERDTQSQDQIFEAFPLSTVIPEKPITKPKRKKVNKSGPGPGPGPGSGSGSGSGTGSCSGRSSKRGKKVGEDLNRQVTTDGSKAEWDAQELGLMHEVSFDESTMPIPICSCTGVARQCYKWGSGGWQSACCTTNISVYPLPQMENKRHARMGGRKMSGSVFTRLLSRLAAQGHDLSAPLDLKNYWAKHGTNRYITIK